MRFVNVGGRAALLVDGQVFDLERASGGRVPSDPMAVVTDHWEAAQAVHAAGVTSGGSPLDDEALGPPVPAPRSIFAIGLNYRSHAEETGATLPEEPAVFTKFPTSINGPFGDIVLPAAERTADWEAELAFVVGRGGRYVAPGDALAALAGFTVAQDVSERRLQRAAGGQFCMGKSFDTFCPIGPALVTLDELANPDDLRITCAVNGEQVQDGRTSDMVRGVAELVAFLSSVCTLRPGDLCLTGTPPGVGAARKPPRFLTAGDVVETTIEGVGTMRNRCVAER